LYIVFCGGGVGGFHSSYKTNAPRLWGPRERFQSVFQQKKKKRPKYERNIGKKAPCGVGLTICDIPGNPKKGKGRTL